VRRIALRHDLACAAWQAAQAGATISAMKKPNRTASPNKLGLRKTNLEIKPGLLSQDALENVQGGDGGDPPKRPGFTY
jgi:hypothetical protein